MRNRYPLWPETPQSSAASPIADEAQMRQQRRTADRAILLLVAKSMVVAVVVAAALIHLGSPSDIGTIMILVAGFIGLSAYVAYLDAGFGLAPHKDGESTSSASPTPAETEPPVMQAITAVAKIRSQPQPAVPLPVPTLEETFGFSKDDLAANHQGQMSQQQRSRLETQRMAVVVIPLSIGLFAAIMLLSLPQIQLLVQAILACIVAACIVVTVWLVMVSPRLNGDLIAGDVFKVDGQAEISIPGSAQGPYILHIGDRSFVISANASHAIVPGASYRAFYTPTTKVLLSLERLDQDSRSTDTTPS